MHTKQISLSIYIYPEHDTKECKYIIKHRWFAVNTSTLWSYQGKSDIFVRRIKALLYPNNTVGHPTSASSSSNTRSRWNSVGSREHDIRRTHLVAKSPCSIGQCTSSSNYSPTFDWPSSQKIMCKNFMGPNLFGEKKTYKSGHTNGVVEPQSCAIPNLTWLNICQETTPKSNPMAIPRPFWSTVVRVDQRSDRLRLSSACGLKINQHWKA